MVIKFKLSALRRTRWYEIVLRFLFGGLATVATGMIAKSYGPVIGGVFLAFPAIFPATATLVEKHEKEKKKKAHMSGVHRSRNAVALEARGTAMVGLARYFDIDLAAETTNSWSRLDCYLTASAAEVLISPVTS